jgi:hemerythrin-like domain-containing protein
MATATEILRHEHEAILKMISATEEVARRLDRGERVRPEILGNLLEFFRLFADRCHHGKEEALLFPLLESKGLPREGGPIGVMLREHDEGRGFIKLMAEAAEAYKSTPESAGPRWAEPARNYSALLRAHIDKENNILFRIAEQILSADEQARLAEDFEKVELEKMGAGTHERLHAMMDQLLAEVVPQ